MTSPAESAHPDRCPQCGAALPDVRDAYCRHCGEALDPEYQESPPLAPTAAAPVVSEPDVDPQTAAAFAEFRANLDSLTRYTPVTHTLVAANVVVFLVMAAGGVDVRNPDANVLLSWGANNGAATIPDQPWRLLTAEFLHAGLLHLAFNMICLYGAGRTVERFVGSSGFLVLYLSSAVVASLASIIWAPEVVGVGASGAVFGVFGAFFGVCVRAGESIPRPALDLMRKNMLKFLAINLGFGLLAPNIDMAAHVGGLIWGLVAGLLLGHPLTPEAARWRPARTAALAFLTPWAVGVFFVVAQARVANSDDPVTEFSRVGEAERVVLEQYNDAVARYQAGRLTDAEMAALVESELLPKWRELRRRVSAIEGARELNPETMRLVSTYYAAREDAWVALVKALRDKDEAASRVFAERWRREDELVGEITGRAARDR